MPLALAAPLLQSCFHCEAISCPGKPPALTARVLDVWDGGIIHSAQVNGIAFDCPSACAVSLSDGGIPYGAGPVPVEVTAPGYHPVSFLIDVQPNDAEDVTGCCKLGYAPEAVDVRLVPL